MEKNLKGSKSFKKEKTLGARKLFQVIFWSFKINYQDNKFVAILHIASSLLSSVTSIANSFLAALILDKIIDIINTPTLDISYIYKYLWYYFAYNLSVQLLYSITNVSGAHMRHKLEVSTTEKVHKKIEVLGVQTMEHPDVQKLLQSVNRYSYQLRAVLDTSLASVGHILDFVTRSAIIFALSPLIFTVMLTTSIPQLFIDSYFVKKGWKIYKNNQDMLRMSDMMDYYLKHSEFLPEILISKATSYFSKRYANLQWKFRDPNLKNNLRWNFVNKFVNLPSTALIFIGSGFTISEAIAGNLSIGQTSFNMSNLHSFSYILRDIIQKYNNLVQLTTQIEEVYDFFMLRPMIKDGRIDMEKLKEAPSIRVKNLNYNYPNSEIEVLHNITLNIKNGEKIAIVGHNGAGKTTLIKLIAKIYTTDSDKIYINKQDLTDISTKSWHDNLGILFQEYNFYKVLTAFQNISIGRPYEKANYNDIKKCAELADAHDFINEYPDKYKTLMDERFEGGIRPSSGQKQKIAIARFFYRNSPVVIFDEPTAAIDAVSEYKIFNRIYKFFENKTVIIISHRFSTVRNADRIIVMDQGRIIEEGSHDELMKKNGKYAEAFNLQAEGYQSDPQIEGKSTSDHE